MRILLLTLAGIVVSIPSNLRAAEEAKPNVIHLKCPIRTTSARRGDHPMKISSRLRHLVLTCLAPWLALAGPETDPFFTPKQDRAGLRQNAAHNPDLPNVLILGDSISIGYTKPVADRLKDAANVRRPAANCGDTAAGLANLDRWLGTNKWDVIHFNWGLHDLCYRHPGSKVQGNRDKVNGKQSVPPEQYEKNLETLVQRLGKTGAKLIWASTTVVPEGEAGRFVGDDVKYNGIARRVMDRHGIPIDDLHALTAAFGENQFTGKGNVHYTPEGYARIAEQVAASIRRHGLPAK